MAFETLNLILSTVLSITFMQCCKIVLMFYNYLFVQYCKNTPDYVGLWQ